MRSARHPAVIAAALLSLVLLVLGLQPVPVKSLRQVPDVLSHGAGYAALAFASTGAARALGFLPAHLVGWVYAVGHGAALEVLQSLIPSRRAQWRDLLADAVGSALGAALAATWARPR